MSDAPFYTTDEHAIAMVAATLMKDGRSSREAIAQAVELLQESKWYLQNITTPDAGVCDLETLYRRLGRKQSRTVKGYLDSALGKVEADRIWLQAKKGGAVFTTRIQNILTSVKNAEATKRQKAAAAAKARKRLSNKSKEI